MFLNSEMTSQVIDQTNFSRRFMSAKVLPPDQFIIVFIITINSKTNCLIS